MITLVKTNPLFDAVHLATRKLAEIGDVNAVLSDVLSICVEAVGAKGGTIYLHEPATRKLRFLHVLPEEIADRLERLDIPDDYGVAGRVFQSGKTEISSFPSGDPEREDIREKSGVIVRTMITLPLQIKGMEPIGIVQLVNKRDGEFTEEDEAVLDTVSDVCTLAVINSRLLEQSKQVASLEGMGRTAHDLANKAGVLITFLPDFQRNLDALRGVLRLQGVRGDAMLHLDMLESTFKDVFAPYSERVYRYARLINDLAAGKQLQPKMKAQSLPIVVGEAVEYMLPQARRSHVELVTILDREVPELEFDDLYVIRIIENIVGNAIKAVAEMIPDDWAAQHGDDPDAVYGKVTVSTSFTGGKHSVVIRDEGPGLSPGTIRKILSGQARSEWGQNSGTGLGTKVIVELSQALNAKLSIHSKLGEGSTFTVEFGQKP